MEAKLTIGVLVFSLVHVDGEPTYYDVAELFHEIPMENREVCRRALREDSNRMIASLEETMRAFWTPYMETGEELVVRSGASCGPA